MSQHLLLLHKNSVEAINDIQFSGGNQKSKGALAQYFQADQIGRLAKSAGRSKQDARPQR